MKKPVITITQDGMTQTFSGDTVLAFTVDHKNLPKGTLEVINVNEIYSGSDIPYKIFPELIGTLVASFIKHRGMENEDKPLHTAFELSEVSKILKAHSDEICNSISKEDMEKELKEQFCELTDVLGDLLQKLFEEGNKE